MATELGTSEGHLAHAPVAAPGARHDGRSVGELLREADHLARELLLDLSADDAPGLLRSWGGLVDAAADAWQAITDRATPPARADVGEIDASDVDPMARLRSVTGGITTTLAGSRWPGPGAGAPSIDAIATTFDRVGDLVTRRGHDLPLDRLEVRADAAAAQMSVMHTVYLSAHAATSALQQHGRRLHHDSQDRGRPLQLASQGLPYAVGPTRNWVQRLGVCESIAGRYVDRVNGGFARAVAGAATPPPEDPDRLHLALATWDVQVHRTLASDPSPRNLVLASRTQSFVAATALPLLGAAEHAGLLPHQADSERIHATITASGEAWNQLANRWADLASSDSRADPDLTHTASQLRAACRELTHRPGGPATPQQVANTVDLPRAIDGLCLALEAAVDVAHLAREPSTDPDLTGPARALSIRAHNDTEFANEARPNADHLDVVWVSPGDVLANKLVPLPRPVSEGLVMAARDALTSSATAASAVAGASRAHRPGPATGLALAHRPSPQNARPGYPQATRNSPSR